MKLINVKLELIEHHPNQPRTKLEGIKELADSIRARGIIVPPIVVADGNRYVLVDGHRRIAAAKLAKLTEIPVNVAEDWTEATMLEDAMAANIQRKDMTAGDTARGVQLLMTLGVDHQTVKEITGYSDAQLACAAVIAKAPKKAARVAEVQASLEEGAALVEFAGDEKVVAELTENIGTARFAHTLATARQAREWAEKCQITETELTTAGVRVLKGAAETWNVGARPLGYLYRMTPENHADCEGHAATVENDGEITYWCTKPGKHNSISPSAPKTEKQRDEDRAKRASRAAFKACRTVRHEYARRLIAGLGANKGHSNEALVYIAHRATEHGIERREYGGQTRSDEFMPLTPTPVQTLLVLAIAQQEKAIDDTIKFNAGLGMKANIEGRYYDLLQLAGYELAECEAAVIKADACRTCGGEKKTFVNRAGIREYSTCPACKGTGKRGPATVVGDDTGMRIDESAAIVGHMEGDSLVVDDVIPGRPIITKSVVGDESSRFPNLAPMELSLIWRRAKDSGRYEYNSPGSGGKIVYTLAGANGTWVLHGVGLTSAALMADAERLAIVAGLRTETDVIDSGIIPGALAVRFSEVDACAPENIAPNDTITDEVLATLWAPDGTGRSVTTNGGARLDLARDGGRVVLAVFGLSSFAATIVADHLGTIAGVIFSYDETETASHDAVAAFVAAEPSGATS